ncbi:MAG: ABC transporter permease subunit, partial [Rhodospirillales bacterium]
MTTSQDLKPSTHKKRSLIGRLWFDKRSRAMIVQVIIIAVVALFIAFIWHNTYENLKQLGVSSGFDFLWQSSGYDINQHLIPYSSVSTHFDAYTVGLINTLLVAVAGCALATLIGFIGGVLRLSNNWLISRISYCYVEFTRNVPVLLQILL